MMGYTVPSPSSPPEEGSITPTLGAFMSGGGPERHSGKNEGRGLGEIL